MAFIPAPDPASSPPREGERRLAAIVFTDIVGYSTLVNRDDANAMRLVEEHFALVRGMAARFGGKVIKTIGDSVHLEFSSAQAATTCSIAIQQAHRERNTRVAEAQRFDVRIGAHTGDVEHRGGDIYGDGVNIAARLQPLAPVGGIAISDHVRNQLRQDQRSRFVSHGTPRLKNIETGIELFVLEADALAAIEIDLPAPATPEEPAEPVRSPPARRRSPIAVAAALILVSLVLVFAFLRSKGRADIPDQSIAVLPFVDMSQAKDQEYFSDGIAEDLLNLLTKVPSLQVAARTSSFSFKGKDVAIPEIARSLRVAKLLEGSVRKAGDAVRVTVRLVRAADGYEIWSHTWDRQLDDIFRIQDEIAAEVARQVVDQLGTVPTAHTADPTAYAILLEARQQASLGTAQGHEQAITLLQQALAIDPGYPEPWSLIAQEYIDQANKGLKPIDESYRLARAAVEKALALDPKHVGARLLQSRIASDYDANPSAAARYIEEALALEPTNLRAISSAASLLQNLGRLELAAKLDEYVAARDPLNPKSYGSLAYDYGRLGRLDESIANYRTALRLSPGRVGTAYNIGELLLRKGEAAAALAQFQQESEENWRLMGLAMALHALGRKSESDAALSELIAKYKADSAYNIAYVVAFRGEVDRAFEWLEIAIANHDTGLVEISSDPMFASIHDDPRWLPLLQKTGNAPEQLAKIDLKVTLPRKVM